MKAFVEFCEQSWPRMSGEGRDASVIAQMQQLLAAARGAAGDGVYAHRIDRIIDYTRPLTARQAASGEAGAKR